MNKRLLGTSVLAVLALASVSAHSSYGDSPPAAPVCYNIGASSSTGARASNLSYDVERGAGIYLSVNVSPFGIDARVPLTVGDEPNPHFDRLYALLMKGLDGNRLQSVCIDHVPTASEPAQIVSVSLGFQGIQKVSVCDQFEGSGCAGISAGRLLTRTP